MDKQSNTYTILYSIILVLVVGVVLAVTSIALKPKQDENIANDKRQQILSAVHITAPEGKVKEVYNKYITKSFVVNAKGDDVSGDAFAINMSREIKKPVDERMLPVFVCNIENGDVKYVLPVYGGGLWGPIWGYVAVDADGDTIYGAYFSHSGETPGLGAEISTPQFQSQFEGKKLYKDDKFRSVDVMKSGQKPVDNADYVNAISGGTITSKGVQAMLADCLADYNAFLVKLRKESSK